MDGSDNPCSECDVRPARVYLDTIIHARLGEIHLDPPEKLCLTCYCLHAVQAREEGYRLLTRPIPARMVTTATGRKAVLEVLRDEMKHAMETTDWAG